MTSMNSDVLKELIQCGTMLILVFVPVVIAIVWAIVDSGFWWIIPFSIGVIFGLLIRRIAKGILCRLIEVEKKTLR